MFSRSTNNASPNELINPQILKKNRTNRTYSFAGSWPAIFPAMIIPLVFPDVGAIDWQRVGSWVFTEWLDILGQRILLFRWATA